LAQTSASSTTSSASGGGGLTGSVIGAIVGGIVGGFVILGVLIFCILFRPKIVLRFPHEKVRNPNMNVIQQDYLERGPAMKEHESEIATDQHEFETTEDIVPVGARLQQEYPL
jgi:hypothetical protein